MLLPLSVTSKCDKLTSNSAYFHSPLKKIPEEYQKEPPKGRYADYRKNSKYINGLSAINKKKHLIYNKQKNDEISTKYTKTNKIY